MRYLSMVTLLFLLAAPAAAQQRIDAKAGLINWIEGSVYLDSEPLQFPAARFREITGNKVLRTGDGWVEVQLGIGAFLWMGENSTLKMEDPHFANLRLVAEKGSFIINVSSKTRNDHFYIHFRDAEIEILKPGFYRLDSRQSQFGVFRGKARIHYAQNNGVVRTVKPGMAAGLAGSPDIVKFDRKQSDSLQKIAAQRLQLLYPSTAQQQAAQQQQPWPDRTIDEQRKRLETEEWYRQQEAWRQLNSRRPADGQEGHQQPAWAVPSQ